MAIKAKGRRSSQTQRDLLPMVTQDAEGFLYAVLPNPMAILSSLQDGAEVGIYSVIRIHHHSLGDACDHDHGDPETFDDFESRKVAQSWVEESYGVTTAWTRVKDEPAGRAWTQLLLSINQGMGEEEGEEAEEAAEAPEQE